MPCQINTINENTWIFEEEGVRFFLLAGTEKALLVDAGMTSPDARAAAESVTDLPLLHIITHADPDHMSGSAAFDQILMHPAEEPNFRNRQLQSKPVFVEEGDVLELGGRPVKILHMPGHTPGSIAILDVNSRILMCGDGVQHGRIFMFGPMRDLHAYIPGLQHLKTFEEEFDTLWPSHGKCPAEEGIIDHLIDSAQRILSGALSGELIDFRGRQIRYIDTGRAGFLCEPEIK